MNAQQPGWYPDPLGGQGARYWDGTKWDGAITPEPEEFPAPTPTPQKSRTLRPVWLVIGISASVIAIAATVFALTRPAYNAQNSAPSLTPSAIRSTPSPTPTKPPAELVAATVKTSMQETFDEDADLKELGLRVVDVVAVHKSDNEFKGIATVHAANGVERDVPVDITADGDKVLWEAPPGAFVFAIDEPSPPAAAPPPPPAPPPAATPDGVEDFTVCPSGRSGVASADTSCAFADNVRSSWYGSSGSTIIAYSPVTDQRYVMHCAPAVTDAWVDAMRCAGTNASGTLLVVYFS